MVHPMTHVKLHARRTLLRRGTFVAVAALILASCNATHPSTSSARSHPTPIATEFLNPNSICLPDQGDDVRQSLNGDYTACFRVPNIKSSSVVVALQTIVEGVSRSPTTALTTTTKPAPNVNVSLSSSVKTVKPGDSVVLTGHLSKAETPRPQYANLCWDGCGGLLEQGVQIRWLSPKKFQMSLLVPQTAWLVARNGDVSVHPLSSGSYQVGLQCLTSISGCALRGPQAKTPITLRAPKPQRCVHGRRCETLTLGPSTATVGDEVMVSGWAPLQDFIGQPFGYSLSVTAGSRLTTYPRLAYSSSKLAGSFNVVLTPTVLRIGQSSPWARLGRIAYLSSTYSGPSAVNPTPTSSLAGWCESSKIVVTGGAAPVNISTAGVKSALRGSTLHFFAGSPTTVTPPCDAVQLDPSHPDSAFASFGTGQGASIPPIYLAPVYTTNAGATWQTVPIPKGFSIEDFGGFTTEGNEVAALFSNNNDSSSDGTPEDTHNGYVTTEMTPNGGVNWTTTTLGCPSTGPCMTFGPYSWGNCNMSQDTQPLLLGPAGETAASGVKWRDSTWVTSVNSCDSSQLVASTPKDLLLIDPSSEYPLLRSTNSGLTWTNWELPSIPAANYGLDSVPLTNSMVLAPDGSLFASITNSVGNRQELYRLYPAATSWCQTPNVYGTTAPDLIQPLRVDATDLLWVQSPPSSMHSVPYAKLTCSS
jgi:hypothetical protein